MDIHSLYEDYNRISQAHPKYGSWEGHIQKYLKLQEKLRLAIARAKANNCPYNPEADTWANEPPPRTPSGY